MYEVYHVYIRNVETIILLSKLLYSMPYMMIKGKPLQHLLKSENILKPLTTT